MKLLTIDDITILAEEGWTIIKGKTTDTVKGICDSGLQEIVIYPANNPTEIGLYITFDHEFYHAVYPRSSDTEAEECAELMVKNHIELLDYARELFGLYSSGNLGK